MTKFTTEQIETLVKMQDELNIGLHPEWRSQGWSWDIAIADELLELVNHLGWKWWRGTPPGLTAENKLQVQLEIIDILHFQISKWIISTPATILVDQIERSLNAPANPVAPDDLVGLLNEYLRWGSFGIHIPTLMATTGLTPDRVMEVYSKKWLLNKFRWANGYKEGTYQKLWMITSQGPLLEDNEVLEELMSEIPDQAQLMDAFETMYAVSLEIQAELDAE